MQSTRDVSGKPVELLEPETTRPRFGLIFLTDSGDSDIRRSITDSERLSRHAMGCAVPQIGSWWSSRIEAGFDPQRSAEHWLLEELLPFVIGRWGLNPNAIAIAGTGAGGQGALRLALKHPARFPIVAAVDAALDHHELFGMGTPLDDIYPSREHCRQDTAILHIHPAKQPTHIWFGADPDSRWFRGNDRLHEKLAALGVSHQFENQSETALLSDRLFQFLIEALKKESRQLL
jgi:pimeloyl-ACP methyl ester carboxylesterase